MLITFSGIDGAGKSTQISTLMKYLRDNGHQPIYLWSRGGYTSFLENIKVLVRKIFRKSIPPAGHSKKRTQYLRKPGVRKIWLYAALIDLIRVYGLNIRYWRLLRRPVICDRYLWDTLLDFKMNFPHEKVEQWALWRLLQWVTPQPDSAFLLMISLEESIRRSQIKRDPFPEPEDVRRKRYALYKELATEKQFQVIDGTMSAGEITKIIKNSINDVH